MPRLRQQVRAGRRRRATRRSSSTRRSTRTRPRTSATCATPRSATRSSACCASAARRSKSQNYIDDTGVQVADVIVGFRELEHRTLDEVAADRRHDALRLLLLGSLLAGHRVVRRRQGAARDPRRGRSTISSTAATRPPRWARSSSIGSSRAHLKTMARLNIGYDLLTYEGDILRLQFWAHAFEILKAQGAVFLQTEGKLAGCWVMRIDEGRRGDAGRGDGRRPSERSDDPRSAREGDRAIERRRHLRRQGHRQPVLEVRPARPRLPLSPVRDAQAGGRPLWSTTSGDGDAGAPPFGHAQTNLQRHRLAADVPAGAAQPGAAHARPSARSRELGPLLLRDGGAVARDGARARLRVAAARRRPEAVRRGVGPQGPRRQDRRPARSADRQGRGRGREAQSRVLGGRRAAASARRSRSPRSATSC